MRLLRGLLERAGVDLGVRPGEPFGLREIAEIADLLRGRKLTRRRVLCGAEADALLRVELALRVLEIGGVQVGERRVVGDVLLSSKRGLRYTRAVATERAGRNGVALQGGGLLLVLILDLSHRRVDDVGLVGVFVLLDLLRGILRRVDGAGRSCGKTRGSGVVRRLHVSRIIYACNTCLLLPVDVGDEGAAKRLIGRSSNVLRLRCDCLIVRHNLRRRRICLRTVGLTCSFTSHLKRLSYS